MPEEMEYLGAAHPRMVLYLPHRPNNLTTLAKTPSAQTLISANSNHWRKIVTLLAKVASPVAEEWRNFRDETLFTEVALCFTPQLINTTTWHWIGGKDNLQRFEDLSRLGQPLAGEPDILIAPDKRLLLTPYPDYRQLSNAKVGTIRAVLAEYGFYGTNEQ